jgi:hypothetical protein
MPKHGVPSYGTRTSARFKLSHYPEWTYLDSSAWTIRIRDIVFGNDYACRLADRGCSVVKTPVLLAKRGAKPAIHA